MKVYSSEDLMMVSHFKNILEINGINCEVYGEFAALGERADPNGCVELWITDASQSEQAKQIIQEAIECKDNELKPWKCPNCQEEMEGQFTECWKCRAIRPEPI